MIFEVDIMKKIKRKNSRTVTRFVNQFSMWILLIPAVFVLYFYVWRPQVMGVVWSFFKMKGYTPTDWIGITNYVNVVTNTEFIKVLLNTVKYVVFSFFIGYFPPILLAVMINEMVRTKNFFKTYIYLPTILPMVAVTLIWYLIYYPDSSGFLNSFLVNMGLKPYAWLNDSKVTIILIVIAMTWKGCGGSMLLYFSALQGVNTELYEAAMIDGAGMLKRFRHITLPQISGTMLICVVTQIIGVFQTTEEVMTMTDGGPNGASITLGYQLYKYGFVSGRVGEALALGNIMFLILIIMTCFYFVLNKKVEQNMG